MSDSAPVASSLDETSEAEPKVESTVIEIEKVIVVTDGVHPLSASPDVEAFSSVIADTAFPLSGNPDVKETPSGIASSQLDDPDAGQRPSGLIAVFFFFCRNGRYALCNDQKK